jgi:hypothetical protein
MRALDVQVSPPIARQRKEIALRLCILEHLSTILFFQWLFSGRVFVLALTSTGKAAWQGSSAKQGESKENEPSPN